MDISTSISRLSTSNLSPGPMGPSHRKSPVSSSERSNSDCTMLISASTSSSSLSGSSCVLAQLVMGPSHSKSPVSSAGAVGIVTTTTSSSGGACVAGPALSSTSQSKAMESDVCCVVVGAVGIVTTVTTSFSSAGGACVVVSEAQSTAMDISISAPSAGAVGIDGVTGIDRSRPTDAPAAIARPSKSSSVNRLCSMGGVVVAATAVASGSASGSSAQL